MSLQTIVVIVLLTFGVAVELACCLGVLMMDDALDKLHYIGPAAIFSPLAIALAIVIREALSPAGIKSLLTAALLVIVNPVLTHAIGRALYIRRRDHLEPEPPRGASRR
jgi:monovalent cation/proton antiporter MnhG/PhaG subunit